MAFGPIPHRVNDSVQIAGFVLSDVTLWFWIRLWLLAITITLAAGSPSVGQPASITDGDTLKLGGTIYRLWGIDAPETKQDCSNAWPAGRLAATRLQSLVQGRAVVCEAKDKDRYGRTIAICRAAGQDLGAIMVREGMAWAFVRYSPDYVREEEAARAAGRGVHAHQCELPWEWRTRNRGDR